MNNPMIFTPEYYDRMRQLEASGWWNRGMREAAERLINLAALPEHGTLIDVGCGSGQTMGWFRDLRPGWTTYGLDLAPEGLRAARHFGEQVVLSSALEMPFADQSADMVVTLDVLQHLPLPAGDRTALAEIARVLRPGGWLLVRTNAQAFPHTADDAGHNFHKYELGELVEKIEACGFDVLRGSRINALLGLAEIPRELRAHRREGDRYHGILAGRPTKSGPGARIKQRWLELEGRMVAAGIRLPAGRTLIALCQKNPSRSTTSVPPDSPRTLESHP